MNPSPGAAASNAMNAHHLRNDRATAGRLLDQATFGPSLATIRQVQSTGVDAWITQQFNTPDTPLAKSPRLCRHCAWLRIRPPTAKSQSGGRRCSPGPTNCGSAWHSR